MKNLKILIVPLILVVTLSGVVCQYPEGKLACYIEGEKLKFDIHVLRNNIPFERIYFTLADRTELTDTDCPQIAGDPLTDDVFSTSFYVDPTTDLLTDGRSCGIDVVESGKEYQFRIETEREFERDRGGDIVITFNCHADYAFVDVISSVLYIRYPGAVILDPPVEDLRLLAVTTSGGDLPTTTLNDGRVIPTINIGDLFALQLFFETTEASSATGATCKKLYASVDDTFTTFTDDLIDPTSGCPATSAAEFLKPATGLKLVTMLADNSYIYRTGAIMAAKYYKSDIPEATDIIHFACEAKFCHRIEADPECVDPCAASGRKKREVEVLNKNEFKKLVKRNADKMITVDVKIQTEREDAKSEGVSMVIVWSLVGVACLVLVILAVCLVAFCRVRRQNYGRSNAYKHHIDASSISSSNKPHSDNGSSVSVDNVKAKY